ncbi:hypothetical protein ACOMHN_026721 [Nucella lapillus]
MGNCIRRCFGVVDKRRKYLKTRYNVERDQFIEFENLMDEDANQDEMSRLLTDREKQLLKSRQFDVIVHEQTQIDKEIENKLAEDEEELKRDEEVYLEAKRESSRIAKLHRAKEKASQKNATVNGSRSWLGDDEEWEVAGGDDDFELFLANVKARSVAARAEIHSQGDGPSSSSSTAPTKERSLTEASSLDLEWDLEAGLCQDGLTVRFACFCFHCRWAVVQVLYNTQFPPYHVTGPVLCCDSHAEDTLAELTSLHTTTAASSLQSTDLEWDHSFVSGHGSHSRQQLID